MIDRNKQMIEMDFSKVWMESYPEIFTSRILGALESHPLADGWKHELKPAYMPGMYLTLFISKHV